MAQKLVDNVLKDLTAEEEIALTAKKIRGTKEVEESKIIFAQKEAKKASGKTKLKNLGLDDEEIKELTGA